MKTESEIKDDIYAHIKGSELATAITGTVYKRVRDKGSNKEDIAITILGKIPMSQQQDVAINVNIYVPEKLQNGQYAANEPRERILQKLAEEILKVGGIGKDFRFTLESQETFEVLDSQCHERCINNRLTYNFYNEE